MSEARLTSTARVKAHRARKRVGIRMVDIELSDQQIDWLADKRYLDGDNTLEQAIVAFLADHMPSSRARV